MAAEIDEEVKGILEAAKERTREILAGNKALLEKLTARLLEKEVVGRDEFEALLAEAGVVREKAPDTGPVSTTHEPVAVPSPAAFSTPPDPAGPPPPDGQVH